MNVLIAGGNKEGRALLESLVKSGAVKVAGVADQNAKSPAMRLARELKIPAVSRAADILRKRKVGLIIDVTGSKKVRAQLLKDAPAGTDIIGRRPAKLICRLIRSGVKAREAVTRSVGQLERRAWGIRKVNESVKVLYKELENKNRELRDLDRTKSDFLSTVSHEIRTPMTSIRESVSQVLDGILGPTTKEQREFLSMALTDVDRLSRIISNLLDVAKIESGRVNLMKEKVDLVGLAREVRARFDRQIKEKGIGIKESFSRERIEVRADRDRMIEVFANLISNAVKFTDSGYVEISIKGNKDDVECCVADTGAGISVENIPKVFGKFQQFGRNHGPEKGTGLGLSIVKGILAMHGGSIRVDSREGKGTKFIFTLPA